MIITIDGPSISGKTSVALMLAQKLQFNYIASGLLFRGLAYVLMNQLRYHESQLHHPKQDDIEGALAHSHFKYIYSDQKGAQVFWKENDITSFLSDQKFGKYASIIGTNQSVRNALARLQHEIADNKDLVTDGRDAGSVIFPHADIKFFLTASREVRAHRWQKNQQKMGRDISYDQAVKEITERDERDSNRTIAPLRIPKDAIIIDNSDLTQEQTLQKLLNEIQKKGGIQVPPC